MCDILNKEIICDRSGTVWRIQDQKELDAILTQAIRNTINVSDERVFSYSKKILDSILYESHHKFCWFFASSLRNYVEWLYTHSFNVAIISLLIAIELDYKEKELWNIGLGAFLHDVGKLQVPKSIIQKPGPLNDMEMDNIRQHCEMGINFLLPFCIPKESKDIIWQHHERLDGSGYPNGLISGEISRGAEIVMVADVLDAITSARPYKQAQKIDTAIKVIRNEEKKYSKDILSIVEKYWIKIRHYK